MNVDELKTLIERKESHTLEFKKSTSQLKSAFETVCAFLNAEGGCLLFGVTDNGQMVGQNVTDNTQQELARELAKIEPPAPAEIKIEYIELTHEKQLIVLHVSTGKYIPYTYDYRPFQRSQSTTTRMLQHRYEQLLLKRGQLNYSWEELPAENYKVDDLDLNEINSTIKQSVIANRIPAGAISGSITEILLKLKLIKNGSLTNAAVILFAKDVFPEYSQCLIKLARFRGTDKLGEFIDNQRIFGNAFKILAEADMFIKRHLPVAGIYQTDHLARLDKLALPALAIREALINAICHRDYTHVTAAISLAIYDDRMEIWNSGILPKELSIDDLSRQHESHPRNKLTAEIFYNRGFIEGWGTGTTKMIQLCQQHGVPEPEFIEYSSGFSVVFRFKEDIATSTRIAEDEILYNVSKRQKKILEILASSQKMAVHEIKELLENSPAARTVGDDLAALKKLGLITSAGIGRGAKWFLIPLGKSKKY